MCGDRQQHSDLNRRCCAASDVCKLTCCWQLSESNLKTGSRFLALSLTSFACLQTDEPLENIRVAEKHVRFLWRWILMPLLFCLIGTIINFSNLPSSTIVKAVGLIFAGESRCAACLLAWRGAGHSSSIFECTCNAVPRDRRSWKMVWLSKSMRISEMTRQVCCAAVQAWPCG